MRDLLLDKAKLIPVLVVAAVIAVGSAGVILLTGDETASTTPTAASSGSASASGGDSVAISIKDFMFDPEPLEVEAGAKIEWVNDDDANHTATSDDGSSFDTGNLDAGQTSEPVTLDKPGEYTYVCAVHPYMHGTVEVK